MGSPTRAILCRPHHLFTPASRSKEKGIGNRFGILLLIFLLLFRLYSSRIRTLLGFRGIFLLRLFLLFLISFFCYCLRVYFLSRIGLYVSPLALFIFNVGSGGSGQALPLPSPSVPPSSTLKEQPFFSLAFRLPLLLRKEVESLLPLLLTLLALSVLRFTGGNACLIKRKLRFL